jgi:two-component system LytT family response regulator
MPPDEVLRVVLVDDEPPALDRLRDAVGAMPGFLVVAEARDGGEAVATIAAAAPHIAIIDIEMPGMNGLDLVRSLDPATMPVVIFATAYDHHAISAFEVGASDFVLKPIDYDRLHAALRRARMICDSGGRGEATAALLRQIDTLKAQLGGDDDDPWLRDIWVQKRSEFRRIDVRDIDWLQSERDFVRIFSRGESYLLRETLAGLEARLDPAQFIRIHRGYILNTLRPLTLHRTLRGGLAARVADGTTLAVGRTYVRALRERLHLPRT